MSRQDVWLEKIVRRAEERGQRDDGILGADFGGKVGLTLKHEWPAASAKTVPGRACLAEVRSLSQSNKPCPSCHPKRLVTDLVFLCKGR